MLDIQSLTAGYGKKPVLRDINLTAEAYESIALLGPNGSGKTSLLHCITGQLKPMSGLVHLTGINISQLSKRECARRVAVLPQKRQYPQDMRVREMVLLGRYAWLSWSGTYTSKDYSAVEEALELTQTTHLAQRLVGSLSGGEMQRVLLARALAQQSPLLLLDELSSSLDLSHTIVLFDFLEQRRKKGQCLIMVMHDCNLAALYATRIVGLKYGKIIFDGETRTTFTKENLSALYDIQISVFPHPLLGINQALPAHPNGPDHAGAFCFPGSQHRHGLD